MGISVADLTASSEFYADALGLVTMRSYEFENLHENVIGCKDDGSPVVVLMYWPKQKERVYDGNDVKLVFRVKDPAGVIERIRARGGNTPLVGFGRVRSGSVLDPHNYVIEVIRR